jgi:hypothetical protein
VQTIHAFCTRLLHQFPFEANVAARFAVLDDPSRRNCSKQLTLAVLLEGAEAIPTAARPRACDRHDGRRRQTFRDVVRERDRPADDHHGAGTMPAAALERIGCSVVALGVDPATTLAQSRAGDRERSDPAAVGMADRRRNLQNKQDRPTTRRKAIAWCWPRASGGREQVENISGFSSPTPNRSPRKPAHQGFANKQPG